MVLVYVYSVLAFSLNGSLGRRKMIMYFPVNKIEGTSTQKITFILFFYLHLELFYNTVIEV